MKSADFKRKFQAGVSSESLCLEVCLVRFAIMPMTYDHIAEVAELERMLGIVSQELMPEVPLE